MGALPNNDRLSGPFTCTGGETDLAADFPLIAVDPTDAVGVGVKVQRKRAGVVAVLTPGAGFSIVNPLANGFTARLNPAAEAGDQYYIYGVLPAKRGRAHTPGGAIRTATLEGDALQFAAAAQEARRDAAQALKVPFGETPPSPAVIAAAAVSAADAEAAAIAAEAAAEVAEGAVAAAKARANHTGTQPAATISDFADAVDARSAALAALIRPLLIGDAVVDGDLTKAPTQNAIYDHVAARLAALVAASPAALDTLNELAAALANDPNFATTMTNALAGKQPLATILTQIAGLAMADNDVIQRKAGVMASRTMAQLKTDLALNLADNTADASKPVSTLQRTAISAVMAALFPGWMDATLSTFSSVFGAAETQSAVSAARIVDLTNGRYAFQTANDSAAASTDLICRQAVPAIVGRVYRVRALFELVSADGGAVVRPYVFARSQNDAYAATSGSPWFEKAGETPMTVGEIREIVWHFAGQSTLGATTWMDPSTARRITVAARFNRTSGNSQGRIHRLEVEDVTDNFYRNPDTTNLTGTLPAPFIAKFYDRVSLREYGVQNDGANYTTACNLAFNEVALAGKRLMLPAFEVSTDKITVDLSIDGSTDRRPAIEGEHPRWSRLRKRTNNGEPLLVLGTAADERYYRYTSLKDFWLVSAYSTGEMLQCWNLIESSLDNVKTSGGAVGFDLRNFVSGWCARLSAGDAPIGYKLRGAEIADVASTLTTTTFSTCVAIACSSWGWDVDESRAVMIRDSVVESCGTNGNNATGGIRAGASMGVVGDAGLTMMLENVWFEAVAGRAGLVSNSGRTLAESCKFVACPNAVNDIYWNAGTVDVQSPYFAASKTANILEDTGADTGSVIADPRGLFNMNVSRTKSEVRAPGIAMNFPVLASDPAGGVEGLAYVNSTTHKLRVYVNGAWADMH